MSSFETRIEVLSPAKAQKYLKTQKTNRSVRKRIVERYANDIRRGEWTLTGDALKFDQKGVLRDGQHRCQAVIAAGRNIQTLVIRGLDEKAIKNLDTGIRRTPGDILTLAGFTKYSTSTAAAIRMASSIINVINGESKPATIGKIPQIGNATLIEWASEHKESLEEAVRTCTQKQAKAICSPPSLFSALYFILAQQSPRNARVFFERLINGLDYDYGNRDPIFHLRRQLETVNSNKSMKRPSWWKAAILFKAWNAYMLRDHVHMLKFGLNEQWPKLVTRKSRVRERDAKYKTRKK